MKKIGIVQGKGDAYLECVHPRHKLRWFNVRRLNCVACDKCKVFTVVGYNIFSHWREETAEMWQANIRRIKGYREIREGLA